MTRLTKRKVREKKKGGSSQAAREAFAQVVKLAEAAAGASEASPCADTTVDQAGRGFLQRVSIELAAEASFTMGCLSERKDDYLGAEGPFKKAVSLCPGNEDYRYRLTLNQVFSRNAALRPAREDVALPSAAPRLHHGTPPGSTAVHTSFESSCERPDEGGTQSQLGLDDAGLPPPMGSNDAESDLPSDGEGRVGLRSRKAVDPMTQRLVIDGHLQTASELELGGEPLARDNAQQHIKNLTRALESVRSVLKIDADHKGANASATRLHMKLNRLQQTVQSAGDTAKAQEIMSFDSWLQLCLVLALLGCACVFWWLHRNDPDYELDQL
jgi:hypothetical protein